MDMIYELILENEEDGVFAMSFVELPAIEKNFLFFNKEEIRFSSVDEERRLVMGPILIPDKQIIRADGEGLPYYVFFSKDTIQKLAERYLKNGLQASATLEHDKKIDNVTLTESWIVESRTKDKTALYNMNLPVGTWVGTFKIDNDEIWNDYIKTGKVKGISIEGLFEHKLVEATKHSVNLQKPINELNEDEAKELLNLIHSLLMPDVELEEGVPHYTIDGKLYEGPTHKDADGRLMTGEVHTEDSEYLYHKEELEAQPSITSTYPGQSPTGSISPATL